MAVSVTGRGLLALFIVFRSELYCLLSIWPPPDLCRFEAVEGPVIGRLSSVFISTIDFVFLDKKKPSNRALLLLAVRAFQNKKKISIAADLNSSGDRGGMDHFEVDSEVAEALTGFLNDDDPSLNSIEALFQKDFMAGYIQQQPPPLLEQQPPPQLFEPNVYPTMAPPSSLSAQSVAARKRRKRISEKTQELAQLIPGGIKLSTADMFQAAHKYIKFLEAQLAVLELTTPSVQECGSRKEDEYLYALLASLTMQEKLAAQEMCLVPLYELP